LNMLSDARLKNQKSKPLWWECAREYVSIEVVVGGQLLRIALGPMESTP